VLGELPLGEVLEADRNELHGQVMGAGGDGDDEATRECLHLILADAVETCVPEWIRARSQGLRKVAEFSS